ncbi:DUF4148 domain-containing protein [Paraburkholderia phenazinium]|jgi:hypothetical protein|uniref:DUF4148 domain-containing protein n=1 Tax=Paraburkholderia phenazinium TaxID=60549 RepID=A0A1G7ZXA3_9BURK|nr:DUF4148 domain-containing protein [Paraburkholderia phenazinium]SDH13266.1 protein of unknown function [Paraburkholderia phenazinium]
MKLATKTATRTVLMALLLAGSASAMAAPHLTPQECNDYPFKPLKAEVTHRQLMRELGELEAVGYNPAADDAVYPADLEAAQKKLQAEYRSDCATAAPMTNAQGAGNAAAPAATGAANPAS